MDFLSGIEVSADALTANKIKTDLIAQNIANAHTTKDVDGEAYKRKVAVFESYMNNADSSDPLAKSVHIESVQTDTSKGAKIYDPTHPHADAEGMLQLTNVQVAKEMVDLMAANHAYDANITVIATARQMAQQALSIGK